MPRATPILAALLAAALATAWPAAPASAATFTFLQTGFSAGGELRFVVTGTDINDDGYLERGNLNPIDEITGFGLRFAGNPLIEPFTLGLADLLIFGIDLAALDFLGPDAIIFAGDSTVAYIAGGPSVGTDCTDAFFRCGVIAAIELDSANSPPLLVSVPAPAGFALFGLGLAALVGLRRR